MKNDRKPMPGAGKARPTHHDRPVQILFLEEKNVSTGGHLDHIYEYFRGTYRAEYIKVKTLEAARSAISEAEVIWLEWASPLMAEVTQHVESLRNHPVIVRLHGHEVFMPAPLTFNWDVVDRLIFVAEHKRRILRLRNPELPDIDTVIRNGVNTDMFSVPDHKQNTKNLLLLGHINYRKGLPMLLQFFHTLLTHDEEYHLYIRGDWQDPRYQMAIKTMVRELALDDHVTFITEWIDDLNAWLADKSHILSFSLEESFHYAIGNGMAAGLKPIIHAWTESRAIWPEQFIFRNQEEFLKLMLSSSYRPHKYRALLDEHNLTKSTQLRQIERELAGHLQRPLPAE